MLTKDTRRRSAAEVARYVEEVGGIFYPFSGNNSLGICAEVLPRPMSDRAMSVDSGCPALPVFKPATLRSRRDAQLAALKEDADDVVTFARKLVRRKFFGAHPMALDPQGDPEGVGALSSAGPWPFTGAFAWPQIWSSRLPVTLIRRPCWRGLSRSLRAFHRGRTQGMVARVEGMHCRKPPGTTLRRGRANRPWFSRHTRARGSMRRTTSREKLPTSSSAAWPPGCSRGCATEKGLAYFVRSERVVGTESGMFCFLAGTQPGREAEVQAEIDAEILRVQSGQVSEAELRRCRERLKAAWRQQSQTNSAQTFRAGLDALQGRP